jgi:ArsR family transcriptional regulator
LVTAACASGTPCGERWVLWACYFAEMRNSRGMRSSKQRSALRHEASVFKALGHPARLQVVTELAGGERCVCDLVELTGLGWSTVSRHLSVLRAVGVIEDEKRGLQVFYRLKLPCVARFTACLHAASEGQDVSFTVRACCGERAS